VGSDDSFVIDDVIRENKNLTCKEFIKKYVFMMWDGIGFFGMDTVKLKRLRGKKPGWCDSYRSPKRALEAIIIIIVVATIFRNEILKVNTIVSSEMK